MFSFRANMAKFKCEKLINLAVSEKKNYCERRRRRGDGSKRDIFEEKSAASQDEYFRKEAARQLQELKERLEKLEKAEKDRKNDKGDE